MYLQRRVGEALLYLCPRYNDIDDFRSWSAKRLMVIDISAKWITTLCRPGLLTAPLERDAIV